MSLAHLQVENSEIGMSDMSRSDVQQAPANCVASLKAKTLDDAIPSQELLHKTMHKTLPTRHAEVIRKCTLCFPMREPMLLNRLWLCMSASAPEMLYEINQSCYLSSCHMLCQDE